MGTRIRIVPVPVFHRPLKISLVLLIAAGGGLAIAALIAALIHHQSGQAWAFLVVALALAAAASTVVRGVRWVIVVCFVALAGQAVAILGTAIELATGVAAVKQRQLHSLGFDPTVSVAINLIYSTVGFGLFCWLAWRWKAQRDLRADPSRDHQV
jgi:hypothetical protein